MIYNTLAVACLQCCLCPLKTSAHKHGHALLLFFFPLASWSFWQANYHFQQYPDMQIENCTQQSASFFWQGGGSWDVCVGRDFLSPSPSFPPPPLFLRTMGTHVKPLVSWGEWRLERGWSEISEKYQKRCNFPCNQANNSIYINHAVYSRIWGRRRRTWLGSQESLKGWCLFHLVGHCPLEEASRFKSKLSFLLLHQCGGSVVQYSPTKELRYIGVCVNLLNIDGC